MARYLVRYETSYSVEVEAANEDEAIDKAPIPPGCADCEDGWQGGEPEWSAEKLEG